MNPHPDLDRFSVDQLLDGAFHDAVIGPFLDALVVAPLPHELDGAATAADQIAQAFTITLRPEPRARGLRRLTTRTGVFAAAGVMACGGVAAAATGMPVPMVQEIFDKPTPPALIQVEEPPAEDDFGLIPPAGETRSQGPVETLADELDAIHAGLIRAEAVERTQADKARNAKAQQAKADKSKAEKSKADEAKADEVRAEAAKANRLRVETAKAERAQADKAQAERAQADKAQDDKSQAGNGNGKDNGQGGDS